MEALPESFFPHPPPYFWFRFFRVSCWTVGIFLTNRGDGSCDPFFDVFRGLPGTSTQLCMVTRTAPPPGYDLVTALGFPAPAFPTPYDLGPSRDWFLCIRIVPFKEQPFAISFPSPQFLAVPRPCLFFHFDWPPFVFHPNAAANVSCFPFAIL